MVSDRTHGKAKHLSDSCLRESMKFKGCLEDSQVIAGMREYLSRLNSVFVDNER